MNDKNTEPADDEITDLDFASIFEKLDKIDKSLAELLEALN